MAIVIPLVTYADMKLMITLFYGVIVLLTIAFIIFEKRDPVKSIAWIVVIALIPVLGLVLYILFGRNHRKEKIFNRKEIDDIEEFEEMTTKQLEIIKNPDSVVNRNVTENRHIITLMLNNNKALLTMNNRVTILNNGKATFASIFEALRGAKSSIHIEYYIFENDRIGRRIANILMEKAKAGVEVRFIYDDVGSWGLSRTFIKKLRKAGVETGCFMPVAFPWFTSKINYRNHRKIVVIDGSVAYTGGINVAERYLRRGKDGLWRDTHLMLEGDSVAMLQAIFATDWYFVTKKKIDIISGDKYIHRHSTVEGDIHMQIASSGPDSDWASIMQAFFAAITRAENHIYISSPYFLPNQAVLLALKVAALSGIDVRVMIPSRSDSKIVYWATRSYIIELMEAGIKIYLYKKGFNHSKTLMIDSKFSSVGTANMDFRSFEDNFEVTALIYDREKTVELEEYFLNDLDNSELMTIAKWEQRSTLHSVYESLARLLSPLL